MLRNQVEIIHKFFIPENYRVDEVAYRKARIFINTSLLTCLFAIIYLVVASLFGMRHSVWMLIASLLVFIACPWLVKMRVSFSICSNLFIGMACISTFWHAAFDGGLTSGVLPWICMTPVTAMIFNNSKNGWFWVIISVLGVATMGILQICGVTFYREMDSAMLYPFITSCYTGISFIIFLFALISENAYTGSISKLNGKNQEIQWEKAIAEQERHRAEQSEKFKQQFLANMSHEIRTPMNTIIGITNLMMEQSLPEEQVKNHLKIIQISSNNLQNIITDVLDISKIEAGKVDLENIEFSIKSVVDAVYQTSLYRATEKKIKLQLEYDNSIAAFSIGDPTKLNQVLNNLVSNAIKFTHDGSVTLTVKKDTTKVLFTVSDTGIGMTKEQVAVIFEPFRQADASTSRKYGGTGLGLYISKQLLALHKAELKIDSRPGMGTTLSFAIEYPESTNTTREKALPLITDEMLSQLQGLRILLAEDNEFNQVVAIETLEFKIPGVVIDKAWNGKEAIEKLNRHDLVLMDIQMPEVDGYEATRKIRTELPAPFNSVPIIALTASIIESDYNKCIALGMNAVIPKPFNTNELLLTIYNLMKGKPALKNAKVAKAISQEAKITNIETLRYFCENDSERVKKYIKIYLESTPKNLAKIKKSLEEKDLAGVKSVAHMLKTHLKYMGMKESGELAETIEKKCNDINNVPELENLFGSMEKMCLTSYSELQEYV